MTDEIEITLPADPEASPPLEEETAIAEPVPISIAMAELDAAITAGNADLVPALAELKRRFGEGEVWA